jgi:hypothetical protein
LYRFPEEFQDRKSKVKDYDSRYKYLNINIIRNMGVAHGEKMEGDGEEEG